MIIVQMNMPIDEDSYTVTLANKKARDICRVAMGKLETLQCPNRHTQTSLININVNSLGDKSAYVEEDFCCPEFREYAHSIYDIAPELKKQ